MPTRRATLRSLAKINLDLRVPYKRPDGYHELHTIFHTISLADTIGLAFTPSRTTQITISGNVDIPGNLLVRAADALLEATGKTGAIEFTLRKRIPMGGGLGGGSSNAATVLLALPVLMGAHVEWAQLHELAANLGSDVPFFLYGGCAAGLGRGTELWPLPDFPALPGLLLTPGIHVSTPGAYRALHRILTNGEAARDTEVFRQSLWRILEGGPAGLAFTRNDFEAAVFAQHPELATLARKLQKSGACLTRMSGSGSTLFALYARVAQRARAQQQLSRLAPKPFQFVHRRQYHSLWRRQLKEHLAHDLWPPRSRYSR
jgi:4-diphosphocytidyl-2-C-methyl-D-erythritol kinase